MKRLLSARWHAWTCVPVIACWLALPTVASGQQGNTTQSLRTGDGLLTVQTSFPSEVRVGQQFQYEVTVRNASDNATLHDIKLRQREGSAVSIESVQQQGQSQQGQNRQGQSQQGQSQQGQNQQGQNQQGQNQQGQNQQGQNQQGQSQQGQNQQGQSQQGQNQQGGSQDELSIDQLKPGESRTFLVSASVDKEGPIDACLLVTSYQPAICLQAKAVKPELEIVKTAPDQSNQCDVIELTYAVKNDGSGTVERFQVVDELADGLKTIEGEDRLAFDVDGLKAGEVRKFVARVYATQTGEFKSRAVAQAENADLKSRSQNVGPKVVGADLQVRLQSSESVYSSQPVMFTAMVTNTGNAPAEDVEVNVRWPQQANLARIGDPQMRSESQGNQNQGNQNQNNQSQGNQNRNQVPTIAEEGGQSGSQNQQGQNQQGQNQQGQNQGNQNQSGQQSQQQMDERQIALDRLEPGQTAEFDYVVRAAGDLERIRSVVEARYICAVDVAQDVAKAEVRKTAQANAVTRVIRVPALQIYTIDDADPVPADEQVTYTIRVRNEGQVADKNIRITANLPQELQFENADGPTSHEQNANQVTFQPVEQLEAGEQVEYTLTATPQSAGSVIFKVELESESQQSAVQAEEPTQLVKSQSSN